MAMGSISLRGQLRLHGIVAESPVVIVILPGLRRPLSTTGNANCYAAIDVRHRRLDTWPRLGIEAHVVRALPLRIFSSYHRILLGFVRFVFSVRFVLKL